jgi:hypothetical protein
MKASTILIALATTLFYSCGSNYKKTDISGTYVTQFKNEYSITSDTIVLTTSESSSQTYNIERRTGFNKVRDGKTLPKQFKVAKWTSSYIMDKQLLQETELGKQISISPDNQSLKLGDTEYQKVK